MLAVHLCVRTVSSFWSFSDQSYAVYPSSSSRLRLSSFHSSIRLQFITKRGSSRKQKVISCLSAHGSFGNQPSNGDDQDQQFLEASLLVSDTILHYRMLSQGFQDDIKWQSSRRQLPMSRTKINSIGQAFLSRFSSPTIFLKISCADDFLLPIIVGEFAIEKLIASFWGDDNRDSPPDQFHLVKNVVEKLGYEVKMVRITERVVNTYFAKLYFGKPGEIDLISVDARPSDAINVATRCKAPIYVNKQIVLTDAIRIGYLMGRVHDAKPTYDVFLDSAADGPDLLTEELDLVKNMNLAVKEERYNDAAMLRDKLMKLRNSRHGQ